MNSLIPMFGMAAVGRRIDSFINDQERRLYAALVYAGETFINLAREHGTYTDRTGNLRNSVGYAIAKAGRLVEFTAPRRSYRSGDDERVNGTGEAEAKARETAEAVAKKYPGGYILIGFAGMEYAAAVESRGYDVISGYTPEVEKILQQALRDAGLK